MRKPHRPLLTLMLLLALPVDVLATGVSPRLKKTLRRFHDPVKLETAQLDELPDRRIAQLRLYTVQSGVATPIPFQFDPRDDDGELVFSDEASDVHSAFDDNDELVFMAKDTGDRATRAALPAISDAALELEVTDPLTGERGWTYLVHFREEPPPPSPLTYATFDVETNTVRAQFYTMEYFPGRDFFTGMRIAPEAGGTGENILDRMKVRMNPRFSFLLAGWSPHLTEGDFSVTIDGVRNGPVRAVGRVRQRLKLGRFFPEIPRGTTYTYYYSACRT